MPLNEAVLFNRQCSSEGIPKNRANQRRKHERKNTSDQSIPELQRMHSTFFQGSPDSRKSTAALSSCTWGKKSPARTPWSPPDRAPGTLLLRLSFGAHHRLEKLTNHRRSKTSWLFAPGAAANATLSLSLTNPRTPFTTEKERAGRGGN